MNRRDLLASLGLASLEVDHPAPSLYIPKPHVVEDRKLLHDFMDEFSFVNFVTPTPILRITHIPVLLERGVGKYGTIFGHIARANPQIEALESRQTAVIVFQGPHSYISPTWYTKTEVVPTWNFATVHASGKLKPVSDPQALHGMLAKLIHKFEDYEKTTYNFASLPDSYKYGLIGGIIGFEMEIEQLEGKFKLGQERSAGDRQGILKNLAVAKPERSLLELTKTFYRSRGLPE